MAERFVHIEEVEGSIPSTPINFMAASFMKFFWTEHSKIKMKQYGLSKQKLLGILYRPERKEQGIVPGTTAVMKTNKSYSNSLQKNKKALGEIWLMYKDVKDLRKIISAWRYPGVSKPGEEIPIPEDIRQELLNDDVFK
ncbi:MAG: hypothetical protein US31_C0003G0035 [Berkelbacteria bacterium GW2011_GWA1_36_9]|uniref:Uncharacterized protein n=1 Tax=Berkelbacteria bacterium GW2011_GWA1_36_9 TaxID=1618331 RepID=A0A0G0IRI5_9BACT|nr:MAG: hypothetical protein US31_C0003G0035 [Berkelbacteria bacterium GW2011_GWA1_36_9]